ncbi:hypothetical protein [Sphingomonas aquatica]|uniref:hypothetical protein n=1 Tax=Sphingomonas aquatica TaxID=1763824 RepID=UPI00301C4FA1
MFDRLGQLDELIIALEKQRIKLAATIAVDHQLPEMASCEINPKGAAGRTVGDLTIDFLGQKGNARCS